MYLQRPIRCDIHPAPCPSGSRCCFTLAKAAAESTDHSRLPEVEVWHTLFTTRSVTTLYCSVQKLAQKISDFNTLYIQSEIQTFTVSVLAGDSLHGLQYSLWFEIRTEKNVNTWFLNPQEFLKFQIFKFSIT